MQVEKKKSPLKAQENRKLLETGKWLFLDTLPLLVVCSTLIIKNFRLVHMHKVITIKFSATELSTNEEKTKEQH